MSKCFYNCQHLEIISLKYQNPPHSSQSLAQVICIQIHFHEDQPIRYSYYHCMHKTLGHGSIYGEEAKAVRQTTDSGQKVRMAFRREGSSCKKQLRQENSEATQQVYESLQLKSLRPLHPEQSPGQAPHGVWMLIFFFFFLLTIHMYPYLLFFLPLLPSFTLSSITRLSQTRKKFHCFLPLVTVYHCQIDLPKISLLIFFIGLITNYEEIVQSLSLISNIHHDLAHTLLTIFQCLSRAVLCSSPSGLPDTSATSYFLGFFVLVPHFPCAWSPHPHFHTFPG